MRNKKVNFLRKKLIFPVIAIGLCSPLFAQDADKVADEVLKNNSTANSEKLKRIDEILRQQNELEADTLVMEAGELLKFSRFEEAINKFSSAIDKYKNVSKSAPAILNKIAETEKQQSRALRLFADKLLLEATEYGNENSAEAFDKAVSTLQQAKELVPEKSIEIDAQLKLVNDKIEAYQHDTKVGKMELQKQFRFDEQKGSIANGILFERAKIHYAHRKFMEAKTTLEQILVNQPYNEQAVNLLQRVNVKIFEAGRERRKTIYQEFLAEVEWKWSEPINHYKTQNFIKSDNEIVEQEGDLGEIYKKLQIVIPKVKFIDRDLNFVVDFIKRTTKDLDEKNEGLNIIISVNDQNTPAPSSNEIDDLDLGSSLDEDTPLTNENKDVINLDADDIPVGEVIRYICDQLNLKYKVEQFALIIGDSKEFQSLETKIYPVGAGVLRKLEESNTGSFGDDPAGGEGSEFESFFNKLGVNFPDGASLRFVRTSMKLVVTNTPENNQKLEEILRLFDIEVPQVSIESKFIEINNTDIQELGVQWSIGRPNHLLSPNGINHQILANDNNVATALNPNIGSANLSNGIRDISSIVNSAAGPVQAGINLIMGDYIFQGLIRALEQEASSDILSAPQVTTISDQTAVIRIVEERYFPTSWEPPQLSGSRFITPSAPEFDEKTDVGIILETTPSVEPDGYTVTLDLRPQILEFLGYDTSLDSEIDSGFNGVGPAGDGVIPITYRMPIISNRSVVTKVTMWDGETVMLGGLIRERVTAVDDKVPYLSDIPLIGRLFRNKGQQNEKRNLLIFVTARLINADGLPKRPIDNRGLPDFKRL